MTTVKRRLHPGQTRAWKSTRRFVGVIAGTGGGKTWFGPIWLYREIAAHPDNDYLVAAPTYGMLAKVTMPAFVRFMEEMVPGIMTRYKAQDKVLPLPGGGSVFFGSADNPLTMEGVHVRAVWLDEAGQMKREAWEVAQRRVGHKRGRILITTTPYNLGWLKGEVYERWTAGDGDYDVVQFPSYWNPTYSREEYERARRTLPSWKFSMFYDGRFERPQGLVYQDFDPAVNLVEPFEIPPEWRVYAGVDWGWTNPTAHVYLAVDHDDRGYIFAEYYERGKHAETSGAWMRERTRGLAMEGVYCDPENPDSTSKYAGIGLPAESANNAIMPGITEVVSLFRSKRLFVFKGVNNLLDEMENYSWQKGSGGESLKDRPVDEYNHACDAMRYAVMGWRGRKEPRIWSMED
jgi:phage terminase large subunit